MYARAVDEAGDRLRELRREEWENLGLGALALALALVATQVRPVLAVPLFLGGLAVGATGLRALWRHWDLLDGLADQRDAYVIPEVLAHASREATMERRRGFAAVIRGTLQPRRVLDARFVSAAEELDGLASELENGALELDPACAVACMRLLSDPESPLFDPGVSPIELRACIRRIRSGFAPRMPD